MIFKRGKNGRCTKHEIKLSRKERGGGIGIWESWREQINYRTKVKCKKGFQETMSREKMSVKMLHKIVILTIYGSETWVMNTYESRRQIMWEMKCLRTRVV